MKATRHFTSRGERIFDRCNVIFLTLIGLSALYPFLYIITLSVATMPDVARGGLLIIPKEISWAAYEMVFADEGIKRGFLNAVLRTGLGTLATLLMTSLVAYPLSRPQMPWRRQISFYIIFTMLFSGGIVPKFIVVQNLGLIDTVWALVLPVMLTAFNVIILKNFFQQIPASYEEAARIDGAGDFTILFRIFIPLSKPALATIALWTCVFHWNSWFDAMLYITSEDKQVLQIFVQRVVIESSVKDMQFGVENVDRAKFSPDALKSATVVVTILPILLLYPLLQRYFIKGINLGGVKE